MTIAFGPLAAAHDVGAGGAQLLLTASGLGAGMLAGGGAGVAAVDLQAKGVGYSDYGTPPVPVVPGSGFAGISLLAEGEGYGRTISGEGGATIDLLANGFGGMAAGFGAGGADIAIAARGVGEGLGYAYLIPRPPVMSAIGGLWMQRVGDRLAFGGGADKLPTTVLRDSVALGDGATSRYDGLSGVTESLLLGDGAVPVVYALARDMITLGAIADGEHTAFIRVVERLILTGEASNVAEATAIVTDALVLGALIDAFQVGHAADTLLLGETIESLYLAFGKIVERLLLAGTPSPSYLAMAVVRDTLLLGDAPLHEADLAALVRDAVGFAANIRLDNGEYIAWVMNTESKGLSRYTNYPFNSFAKIGDRYVGCSPQGLHWLDGATDNGDEIHAKLRLGMEDMGTRRLKNIPDAYIGYTSDGVLLLRAIYTHEATGDRVAATYRLSPREAHETREHRFKLGRGLKAVDWDFEIENVDGSDFMLDNVEFRPLVLNRRTRG